MGLRTNCETCTPPEGSTPVLAVDIPEGLAINLLGIHVEVCPVCVSVFTDSSGELNPQQITIINNLLQALQGLLPSIPSD